MRLQVRTSLVQFHTPLANRPVFSVCVGVAVIGSSNGGYIYASRARARGGGREGDWSDMSHSTHKCVQAASSASHLLPHLSVSISLCGLVLHIIYIHTHTHTRTHAHTYNEQRGVGVSMSLCVFVLAVHTHTHTHTHTHMYIPTRAHTEHAYTRIPTHTSLIHPHTEHAPFTVCVSVKRTCNVNMSSILCMHSKRRHRSSLTHARARRGAMLLFTDVSWHNAAIH